MTHRIDVHHIERRRRAEVVQRHDRIIMNFVRLRALDFERDLRIAIAYRRDSGHLPTRRRRRRYRVAWPGPAARVELRRVVRRLAGASRQQQGGDQWRADSDRLTQMPASLPLRTARASAAAQSR